MNKRLFLISLSIVLSLSFLPTACSIINGNNIATVESIEYHMFDVQGDGVSVNLKPSSGAIADKVYTVDLYESGRFRATQTVYWNESDLQVSAMQQLIFVLPDTELDAYIGDNKNSNDVFSVKIYDAVKSSSGSNSSKVITFTDTNLQNVIRQAINKPTGDIFTTDLQSITELDASSQSISSLAGIAYCANLTTINFTNNKISDISPLASLKYLTFLDLAGNDITNISKLSSLTKLTELVLNVNKISNISPLVSLTNLNDLEVGDNQITDISALASLKNLKTLSLNNNHISNVSTLASLTKITYLELGGNQITDISALASLKNLKTLNLNNNHISNVSTLTSLTNLNVLGIGGNQISNFIPLASLTNLNALNLQGTNMSDISPLASLARLNSITLDNNQIKDISPLLSISGLTKGSVITIRNNPLNVTSINIYIPQLQSRGIRVDYSK